MEALWGAVYDRLSSLDLWRSKAPPEYKGTPAGSPYLVGTLALSEQAEGFMNTATLTLDAYSYGDATAEAAVVELLEDACSLLVTWRVQDTTTDAGSSDTWQRESVQIITEDDLAAVRYRAVFTTPYISQRVADAHDGTVS